MSEPIETSRETVERLLDQAAPVLVHRLALRKELTKSVRALLDERDARDEATTDLRQISDQWQHTAFWWAKTADNERRRAQAAEMLLAEAVGLLTPEDLDPDPADCGCNVCQFLARYNASRTTESVPAPALTCEKCGAALGGIPGRSQFICWPCESTRQLNTMARTTESEAQNG